MPQFKDKLWHEIITDILYIIIFRYGKRNVEVMLRQNRVMKSCSFSCCILIPWKQQLCLDNDSFCQFRFFVYTFQTWCAFQCSGFFFNYLYELFLNALLTPQSQKPAEIRSHRFAQNHFFTEFSFYPKKPQAICRTFAPRIPKKYPKTFGDSSQNSSMTTGQGYSSSFSFTIYVRSHWNLTCFSLIVFFESFTFIRLKFISLYALIPVILDKKIHNDRYFTLATPMTQ